MGNHLIQRKKVNERSKTTQHEPCNVHGHSYIYSLSELILLVTNCCKLLHFLILVYCELLHIYLITFSYLQDEEIKSSCCNSQKNGRLICWRKLEFHYIQLYMCLALGAVDQILCGVFEPHSFHLVLQPSLFLYICIEKFVGRCGEL